jgi:hypothetical protein
MIKTFSTFGAASQAISKTFGYANRVDAGFAGVVFIFCHLYPGWRPSV